MPGLFMLGVLVMAALEALTGLGALLFGLPSHGPSPRVLLRQTRKARPDLSAEPLTPAERQQYAVPLARYVEGQPFAHAGERIDQAVVTRGVVLARAQQRRMRAHTLHYDNRFREYDTSEHCVYGWYDEQRRFHRFSSRDSVKRLNAVGGGKGEALLIIYDRKTLRHFVFNSGNASKGVRSAMRADYQLDDDEED